MMEYDAGPPQEEFAEIFARSLNYEPYREHFWYGWGPIFYRGRLDGTARALCCLRSWPHEEGGDAHPGGRRGPAGGRVPG